MLSNFTAFQKQAFELGQQLLADGDGDDDDDIDLDGLDTGGFGVTLAAAHASDTSRKPAPVRDRADVALPSTARECQDNPGPQHVLANPQEQAQEPASTAAPSAPEVQTASLATGGSRPADPSQWSADGWGSGVDGWEGSWSQSKTPSPVEDVIEQPTASDGGQLEVQPGAASHKINESADVKSQQEAISAANQVEDVSLAGAAAETGSPACDSSVQLHVDRDSVKADAAHPVRQPDAGPDEATVSSDLKFEADSGAAATPQVTEAEANEEYNAAIDAYNSNSAVEHSEQQDDTVTAQKGVSSHAASAQNFSHDPDKEHPADVSHVPVTSSAVESKAKDKECSTVDSSGTVAAVSKDAVEPVSVGSQLHQSIVAEHESPRCSPINAPQGPTQDGSGTALRDCSVNASPQEAESVNQTEQSPATPARGNGLTTPQAVKGAVADHVMFGVDSTGLESTGDSNDGSSSEGIGGMKDMLAIGDSVSQLQGWLWGKSAGSQHSEISDDSADKTAPKLEAAGSPLSISRLSPTVRLVKSTFSPLNASADLTATPNSREFSKQTTDNQINEGAADSVGTNGTPNIDVAQLQEALAARESQLEAQATQIGDLNETLAALQKKNQELVLKGVKVSEEDLAELQEEFETRLGRAERRVFALTKERDAAKRQLASAITPSTLQARDAKISQLENEKADVERRAVNLSHKIEDQARKLTAMETDLANLRNENSTNANRASQAEKAAATALADAESARAAARQASDTGKAQAASAQKRAHAEASDKVRKAEERARIAEEEGGAKVRAQRDQLADAVQQLQEQLAAAEQAYASEEERLQERITAEARARADAEERYSRAEAAVAEATQPLLRRVEALTQELEACQGLLRSAAAGEKRAEAACAAAATEASDAAARATKAEQAMHQALLERDAAQSKAAAAVEALATVEKSLAEEQRRKAALQTESASIAAKLEHAQLELQETKHLLVTAKRSSQSMVGGTAVPASDTTHPVDSSHLLQVTSAVSKLDAAHAADASTCEAAVQNGAGSHPTATDHVRDIDRTASSGSVMDGVVWVPDKGLSVSVSHDGAATDAETYREHWEQAEAARKTLEDTMYSLARDAAGARAERDAVVAEMESLRGAHERHNAAMELLGEREERIAELEADMKDMKLLYREQIDFMATRLAAGQGSS